MSVFRRQRNDVIDSAQSNPSSGSANVGSSNSVESTQMRVPPHVERALITLTTKMQECVSRLDTIEHRLDELSELSMHIPSHGDIMEVRMHSAKLAAELARATVELRGEIGMASEEARRAARLTRSVVEEETTVSLPVDVDISSSSAVDLRPVSDDIAGQKPNTGGWSETA